MFSTETYATFWVPFGVDKWGHHAPFSTSKSTNSTGRPYRSINSTDPPTQTVDQLIEIHHFYSTTNFSDQLYRSTDRPTLAVDQLHRSTNSTHSVDQIFRSSSSSNSIQSRASKARKRRRGRGGKYFPENCSSPTPPESIIRSHSSHETDDSSDEGRYVEGKYPTSPIPPPPSSMSRSTSTVRL